MIYMDSLVSINITVKEKLINPTKHPILYYWDGDGKLEDIIANEPEILNVLKKNIQNYEDYISCDISYFYFIYENNEEKYTENTIHIEDMFDINNFNSDLFIEIVSPIFKYLYKCVFNEEYVFQSDFTERDLYNIYSQIKDKYDSKVSEYTITNYIRTKINSSEKNKNIVCERLKNIFLSTENTIIN